MYCVIVTVVYTHTPTCDDTLSNTASVAQSLEVTLLCFSVWRASASGAQICVRAGSTHAHTAYTRGLGLRRSLYAEHLSKALGQKGLLGFCGPRTYTHPKRFSRALPSDWQETFFNGKSTKAFELATLVLRAGYTASSSVSPSVSSVYAHVVHVLEGCTR